MRPQAHKSGLLQAPFHAILNDAQRILTSSEELFKTELDPEFESSAVKVDMIPASPTKTHIVGILDLPNEIIIFILEDLEDDDLFSLTLLSRHLHHLALPIYLSRNGISSRPSSQLLLFDDRSNSILKALNTALFKPSLNSLLCTLHCHKRPDDLFRQILMINRVVGKVTLHEASIIFDKVDDDPPVPAKEEETVMSRFFGDIIIEDPDHGQVQEFGRELTVMMESILSSGCRSFTISHSGTYSPSSNETKAAILANFHGLEFIKKKATKLLLPFSTMFPRLYPNTTTTNALKTFNLHSPIAIHPHLCRWTINTLNNSKLTSLSISQNRDTKPSVWSMVLPCITIPSLSHLSIDLCSIKSGDLLEFLCRHPLIQNLFLGRNILSPTGNPSESQTVIKNALKHVRQLTAHPKWLVHLLSLSTTPQQQEDFLLPLLSCVRILWRIQNKQHFSFVMLNGLLEPIACRLGSIKELHLVLSFGSISSDWMVPISTTPSTIIINLREGAAGPSSSSLTNTPPLTCVTHLELHIGTYSLPLALTTRLPRWLVEFPVLGSLKMMTMAEDGPFCDSERDFFIRSVLASCPRLGDVEFGVSRDFVRGN